MEEAIKKESNEKGKKSVSYSKAWDSNGIRYNIEVRQVEGGFIIRTNKYGKPKDNPEAEYVDESREFVSTKNPFEKKEEKKDTMFDFVDLPEIF